MSLDDAFKAWNERAADADIVSVALELGAKLRKPVGGERIGPCPSCGGKDRFSINTHKRIFNCRGSGAAGDVIAMVQHLTGVRFIAACEIINKQPPPDRDSELTDEQKTMAGQLREQRRIAAAEAERKQDEFRQRRRGVLYNIWKAAKKSPIEPVDRYLEIRGLERADATLRCGADMPYYSGEGDHGEILHRGPVMIAPIVRADGHFAGLHYTYLDLDRPNGKLRLVDSAGADRPAKKVQGSKQGHRIELISHPAPSMLVIGEGIEKVLAAYISLKRAGWDLSSTAFWTSVDLGNLGGKAAAAVAHPTLRNGAGRPQRVSGPDPDMTAAAIEIPGSVVDLVLIGDSTSDAVTTQCTMYRAQQRYTTPSRSARVAWQPDGVDFDDLLRADMGMATCQRIAAIINGAAPMQRPEVPTPDPARADVVPRDSAAPRQGKRAQAASGAAGPSSARTGAPDDPSFPGDVPRDPPGASAESADPPELADAPASGASPAPGGGKKRSSRTGGSGGKPPGGGGGGAPVDPERDKHELHLKCAWLPQTDLGNVERFVLRYGSQIKWCTGIDGWRYWDGKRWSRKGADAFVMRAEHDTVRLIQEEAKAADTESKSFKLVPLIAHQPAATDGTGNVIRLVPKTAARQESKDRKEKRERLALLAQQLRGWGRKSEQASRLSPISKRAKGSLEVHHDQFDADHFKINVNNGTLVVRRPADAGDEPLIILKPHDPADLITRLAPVDFDPAAACSTFDTFIERVQPHEPMRRFIRQWQGYSMTGDVGEQRLVVHWGKGRNGKGTLLETCATIIGDYADSVPVETFLAGATQKSGGQATPDLAKLPGVRYLRTGEPDKGARFGEALIKRVTGGDPIDARNLNKDFFTFFPQFKLSIACNYKPKVAGTDDGIWGRMILVPWNTFIPENERDLQLGAKLRTEGSGILNWLLDGLRDWLENGLQLGDEIKAATAEYRSDSDPVGRFMEACTEAVPDARTQSSVLYDTYLAWAKSNDGPEYKQKGFSGILDDRGYRRIQNNVVYWVGVKLIKSANDFVYDDGRPRVQTDTKTDERGGNDDDSPF